MCSGLASFLGFYAFWYQTFSAVRDFYDSLVIARFCWQSWCGQDFRPFLQYSLLRQLFCIIIHDSLSFRPSCWVIDHLYYFVIYINNAVSHHMTQIWLRMKLDSQCNKLGHWMGQTMRRKSVIILFLQRLTHKERSLI